MAKQNNTLKTKKNSFRTWPLYKKIFFIFLLLALLLFLNNQISSYYYKNRAISLIKFSRRTSLGIEKNFGIHLDEFSDCSQTQTKYGGANNPYGCTITFRSKEGVIYDQQKIVDYISSQKELNRPFVVSPPRVGVAYYYKNSSNTCGIYFGKDVVFNCGFGSSKHNYPAIEKVLKDVRIY